MPLTAGTRLGPYEVLAPLGAGGMGEVYRARDARLDRDVAIKVLPAAFAADDDRRARFEREAKTVAALSHPNIVAIHDTGLHDGQIYLVMELLTGQSLREALADGALPVRKAIDVAVQMARGLAAAHEQGLVHRDLKPENVWLLGDGRVKILDFGLARVATSGSGATVTGAVLTDPGTVMGTVGYMAPEQVRGQATDPRTDLFALGAVLYEMLAGRRAFQRDTAADTMFAIVKEDPPDLPGSGSAVPPALDRMIRHCLEKNPAERFQTARDVAFALEALSGTGVSSSSGAAAVTPDARRSPVARLAPWIGGALLVGAAAGYLARDQGTSTPVGIAEVSYQPVSFENGFVFAARFGIDRRSVIYSADWDGRPRDVYVTSLDSREYRSLGFPGSDLLGLSATGDLALLTASAVQGSSYARRGTLARASMAGGVGRPELEHVQFADVGPGDTMAVVRFDGVRSTMEYPVGRVLLEEPARASAYTTPRISPSGDHVAFFSIGLDSPGIRVFIYDRAGNKVAESRPYYDWWSLAWAPSGEVWFAAADALGTQTAIFGLDTAGRERLVFRAPGAITLHDIAPTGDVLVSFDRGSTRAELADGTRPIVDRTWRDAANPAGIADNGAVLLSNDRDSGGPGGSVYFWPPDSAVPIRLSDGFGLDLSRDGRRALVSTSTSPPRLSIVPTGTGARQELDLGPIKNILSAQWLPDGDLLAHVVGADGRQALLRVPSARGAPIPALDAAALPSLTGFSGVSPDGTRIAAFGAGAELQVCELAHSRCRAVPVTEPAGAIGGWSPDGQALIVSPGRPGPLVLERLDVASGRRSAWRTITPLQPAVSGIRNVMMSANGAVLYGYGRAAAQLYIIRGLR